MPNLARRASRLPVCGQKWLPNPPHILKGPTRHRFLENWKCLLVTIWGSGRPWTQLEGISGFWHESELPFSHIHKASEGAGRSYATSGGGQTQFPGKQLWHSLLPLQISLSVELDIYGGSWKRSPVDAAGPLYLPQKCKRSICKKCMKVGRVINYKSTELMLENNWQKQEIIRDWSTHQHND